MSYNNKRGGGRGGGNNRGGRGGGGRGGFQNNKRQSYGNGDGAGGYNNQNNGNGYDNYQQQDYWPPQSQDQSGYDNSYAQSPQQPYDQPQFYPTQGQWDANQSPQQYDQQAPPPQQYDYAQAPPPQTEWSQPPPSAHSNAAAGPPQPPLGNDGPPPGTAHGGAGAPPGSGGPPPGAPADAGYYNGAPPPAGPDGFAAPSPAGPEGNFGQDYQGGPPPPPQGDFNNNNGGPGLAPGAEFNAPPGPFMNGASFSGPSGETVPKGEHMELLHKHKGLKQSFDELTKKYAKLKDLYNQERENAKRNDAKLKAKIRELQGIRTSTANLPDESKKEAGLDDDESEEENRKKRKIEVETPKSGTKELLESKASSSNAYRAERDMYRAAADKLKKDLDKARDERSKMYNEKSTIEKELEKVKGLLQKAETEKVSLEMKLQSKGADSTPVGSPYNSDDDGESETTLKQKLNAIYKKKEYYKSRYTALLEQQSKEQSNFLALNQRLLETYVLK